MTVREAVLNALSGVRDPELDEPVTDLGFVSKLEVERGFVSIRLRLPTYFCAPNFAYMMVADAKEALLSVPGVQDVRVVLDDHYASTEINGGVNGEKGFDGTFEGETEGPDLEELRRVFHRKSFVARQETLCRELRARDYTPAEVANLRLGGLPVPHSAAASKYLERRADLGLDVSEAAPLIVDPDGNRVPEEAVVHHLRFARTVRVSVEGNATHCRGLLATRYGSSRGVGEKPDREETTA
jgi:metal-sulfur cluster biosynthetic enzyme